MQFILTKDALIFSVVDQSTETVNSCNKTTVQLFFIQVRGWTDPILVLNHRRSTMDWIRAGPLSSTGAIQMANSSGGVSPLSNWLQHLWFVACWHNGLGARLIPGPVALHFQVTALGKLFMHTFLCHHAVSVGTGQGVVILCGKATVGLMLHWPCVTDFSGLSTYGLTA